ncbi:MAG: GH32 C-terminal domain-containing protein [Candidatus Bathyarchaeia archaeon]
MKARLEINILSRYLNLPVKTGAQLLRLRFFRDDRIVREFEIELAHGKPDFWVFSDVSTYKGRRVIVEVEDSDFPPNIMESIIQSDELTNELYPSLYREQYRPQFHFTSRRGWINDPNGLVYYGGEYHLFYQHNPYGCRWGNMHWGHAVAADLLHWREIGDALEPDEMGTIWSGSAVVDWKNTAGFQIGDNPPIILIYTSAGNTSSLSKGRPFTISIAYSNDLGRTWRKYEKNPVLPNVAGMNRDPKVFWDEHSQRWVMALYLDKNDYGLFSSRNLKNWEELCRITVPAASECPDMFELPINGDKQNTKWVFWVADGRYILGSFDGREFKQETTPQRLYWGDSYAAQTWNDMPPEDRWRIQISWLRMRDGLPCMPFNQQMTFPCELTLQKTREGVRLLGKPVREIQRLHHKRLVKENFYLSSKVDLSEKLSSELLDIRGEFHIESASEFGFIIRGVPVTYNAMLEEVICLDKRASLRSNDGRIRLQVLVDRASIEVFGNDGIIIMPVGTIFDNSKRLLEVYSKGGRTKVGLLEIYEVKSTWLI